MTDDRPEGPLGRWSRLKRTRTGARENPHRGAAVPVVPDVGDENKPLASVTTDDVASPTALEQPRQPDDLPDIDSLGKDSDFTAFLREGVPEELRRQALRVLWRSDPLLANLDGLNDYDQDFRAASTVAEVVRTAYQVGKGYLQKGDETAATEEAAEPVVMETPEQITASEADASTSEDAPESSGGEASATPPVVGAERNGKKVG